MLRIISGASGFIGRRLASRVGSLPDPNVTCLVKQPENRFDQSGLDLLMSGSMRIIPIDLNRSVDLEMAMKPGTVFHLAANTHTWECDQRCNDLGTRNLLNALEPLGPQNHFVFTSTTAVMDNRKKFEDSLEPQPHVTKEPLSRYGRSKLRAEEFLRAESAKQGFPLSIVRLCTVYGPEPRPNTLFDVMKREVANQTLASRLNWPGLTSFIHVDDVVSCLMSVGDNPPSPGETRVYLLATESRTLAEISRMLYRVQGLVYRMISLPKAAWKVLANAHHLCRWGAWGLPARVYNAVWRFNMVVNPVFHCDTSFTSKSFPNLKPRLMVDCIHEI